MGLGNFPGSRGKKAAVCPAREPAGRRGPPVRYSDTRLGFLTLFHPQDALQPPPAVGRNLHRECGSLILRAFHFTITAIKRRGPVAAAIAERRPLRDPRRIRLGRLSPDTHHHIPIHENPSLACSAAGHAAGDAGRFRCLGGIFAIVPRHGFRQCRIRRHARGRRHGHARSGGGFGHRHAGVVVLARSSVAGGQQCVRSFRRQCHSGGGRRPDGAELLGLPSLAGVSGGCDFLCDRQRNVLAERLCQTRGGRHQRGVAAGRLR